MKIGVISSYACIRTANNYGALLQYYALQKYLMNRGHDVFWIRSILPQSHLRIFLRHIKNYKNLRLVHDFYKCHKTFIDFQKKFLKVTSREYKGNDDLSINCPFADFYITGSDQVWGSTLKENYLRFVKDSSKKIAYAASFGHDHLNENHARIVMPWIREFKAVSVREISGVHNCKKYWGGVVEHLLDPTLLIDSLLYPISNRASREDLLFCYFLNVVNTSTIRIDEIRELAKDLGILLKIASCQYSEVFFKQNELIMPSPEQWLQNYHDAKYIITNTFHGTVFAIIFRKPFVTILQDGESSAQNGRMISLLTMLGLKDRILTDQSLYTTISKPIDWLRIEEKLCLYRKKTDNFFSTLGI